MTNYSFKEIQHAGKFDADIPDEKALGMWGTFSVGMFQWALKSNGRTLKKTPSVLRMKGKVSNYAYVKREVRRIIEMKNNDPDRFNRLYGGPKFVTLSPPPAAAKAKVK
ncbi:hypothetical protein [Lewinella sp. W8]|uniref:hypothetical protein n=1 Tax=Lewinella sp. W8 TaxID=2528208 RepID=UPI0010679515|nr:hypothetical protein [Lewinella sp. W8]MTB53062.1 hypothetical protein [Lewinella sp. W8]